MSGVLGTRQERQLGDLRVRPAVKRVSMLWKLQNFFQHGYRSAMQSAGVIYGTLRLEPSLAGLVYRAPWSTLPIERASRLRQLLDVNVDVHELAAIFGGQVTDYGVLSRRKVTTAGVAYLRNCFLGTSEPEVINYHGFGTGTTAESNGDTALVTELTTQYATDNTRLTGTQGNNGANVYRTQATLSPDTGGTIAITEHGVFTAATAGTLWDRSVFSAVNLVAGSDSLQVTYDLTISAEA